MREPADSVAADGVGGLHVLSVVVADDDAAVRQLVSRVLTRAGFQVLEASDGREALRLAAAEAATLVITDLVMPGQEGIETIGMLARLDPRPAIIAISGAFGGTMLRAASALGAATVLQKPFSANQLLRAVGSVLGSAGGRGEDGPLPPDPAAVSSSDPPVPASQRERTLPSGATQAQTVCGGAAPMTIRSGSPRGVRVGSRVTGST